MFSKKDRRPRAKAKAHARASRPPLSLPLSSVFTIPHAHYAHVYAYAFISALGLNASSCSRSELLKDRLDASKVEVTQADAFQEKKDAEFKSDIRDDHDSELAEVIDGSDLIDEVDAESDGSEGIGDACFAGSDRVSSDSHLLCDANVEDTPICKPGVYSFSKALTKVMFVIDRSGSMAFALNSNDENPPKGKSRWEVLQAALSPMLKSLESSVDLGAKFFPEQPPTRLRPNQTNPVACVGHLEPEIIPSRFSAAAIIDQFRRTSPIGGTPTASAIRTAARFLTENSPKLLTKFMILATDGGPNCSADPHITKTNCQCAAKNPLVCKDLDPFDPTLCLDDEGATSAVRDAAQDQNIPTYVIGVGANASSNFTDTLNAMAQEGQRSRQGSKKFFEASTKEELEQAVSQIEKEISQCVYVTQSRPTDPNAMQVQIADKIILRDESHQEGWDWASLPRGAVAFFGSACEEIRNQDIRLFSAAITCDDR